MNKLIEDFYSSFKKLDAEGMIAQYHPEVEFEDPAFGVLKADDARNMWRMLCESQKGKNFLVEYSDVKSNADKGSANWEAKYIFSKTNRSVHNKIRASFEFKDGKIYRHRDEFNLYSWAKKAMGLKGLIFGWAPLFKKALHKNTSYMLKKYSNKDHN